MTIPAGGGPRFFRLLGLDLGSAGVVVSGVVGIQMWIDEQPLARGGPGYVPGVFNTARFLTIGGTGIAQRSVQAFLFTIR